MVVGCIRYGSPAGAHRRSRDRRKEGVDHRLINCGSKGGEESSGPSGLGYHENFGKNEWMSGRQYEYGLDGVFDELVIGKRGKMNDHNRRGVSGRLLDVLSRTGSMVCCERRSLETRAD